MAQQRRNKPTKSQITALEKKLKSKPVLAWDAIKQGEDEKIWQLADDYKSFLDAAKTERQVVREIILRSEKAGFRSMAEKHSDDRSYHVKMGKYLTLAVAGTVPPTDGLRLIVSHIDAPRLDLKPRPLYEDVDLAMLKTHYYGGIKKYQWMSIPLALHGYIVKEDGRAVDLVIGENDRDPVLTIADLLPHLARKVQNDKKVSEAFPGEKMNLITGSLPFGDDTVKERFKLGVLNFLHDKYGLTEDDFISAEFEAVPAGGARDVGLDRGLIGAYAQDDRICSYASLAALLTIKKPSHGCVALFVDKEEIGSDGATGARSRFLEDFIAGFLENQGIRATAATVRRTLMNSRAISADVEGAMDPDYQDVHEKMNAARLGYGVCLTRYTGGGGKYGASEASAEYMGWIRGVLAKEGVVWQSSLLGKIDEGGGGTVAMFLAEHGMEIVDCGPALLGMHSPFEVSHKADLFMTLRAYTAFYQAM
jgi:aspartyl aminopeptidase